MIVVRFSFSNTPCHWVNWVSQSIESTEITMNRKLIPQRRKGLGFNHGWIFSMNITRIVVTRMIADIKKEKGGLLNRLLNQRAIKHLSELRNQIDYAIKEPVKFMNSQRKRCYAARGRNQDARMRWPPMCQTSISLTWPALSHKLNPWCLALELSRLLWPRLLFVVCLAIRIRKMTNKMEVKISLPRDFTRLDALTDLAMASPERRNIDLFENKLSERFKNAAGCPRIHD